MTCPDSSEHRTSSVSVAVITGGSEEIEMTRSGFVGIELRLFELYLQYAYERSDYYLTDNNNYFSIQYNL